MLNWSASKVNECEYAFVMLILSSSGSAENVGLQMALTGKLSWLTVLTEALFYYTMYPKFPWGFRS